jgi:uncharacterized protein (DUF1800 family)
MSMTHPNAVSTTAVDTSELAAIQHRYEEAKAVLHDPAYPLTEEIDADAIRPPVPHDATPPTEGMSTAARLLAQEAVTERRRPSAAAAGPRRWWQAVLAAFAGAAPAAP